MHKHTTAKACALALAAATALGACAGIYFPTPENRAQYVKEHWRLSGHFARAITNGKIMVGMSKSMVKAAWGVPCTYCSGTTHNSWGDTWEYNGGNFYALGTIVFFNPQGYVTAIGNN